MSDESKQRTDAPQSAARRLLAAGDWVTAARYAEMIRDSLPDEKARTCYERLVRTGSASSSVDAEQLRIGRERLAQEALQRLVQRKELEAVGKGAARQYRKMTVVRSVTVFERPRPTKQLIAFERLAFDPRLQMRDLPHGLLFDDDVASEYADRMDAGDVFPLIEVVEEKRKSKEPVYWVFAGFTRGGAFALRDVKSVECLVYPGTFADALFYALSENRKHGQMTTIGDKTKAVKTLMIAAHLMKRVGETGRGHGGLMAAMALACGVSEALVGKIIKASGLRVQKLKLVPQEKEPDFLTGEEIETPEIPANSLPETADSDPAPTPDTGATESPADEPYTYSAPAPAPLPPQYLLADQVDALRLALEKFAGSQAGFPLLSMTTSLPGPKSAVPFLTDITGEFISAVGENQHRDRTGLRAAVDLAHAQRVDPVVGAERMVHCQWLKDLADALRRVR